MYATAINLAIERHSGIMVQNESTSILSASLLQRARLLAKTGHHDNQERILRARRDGAYHLGRLRLATQDGAPPSPSLESGFTLAAAKRQRTDEHAALLLGTFVGLTRVSSADSLASSADGMAANVLADMTRRDTNMARVEATLRNATLNSRHSSPVPLKPAAAASMNTQAARQMDVTDAPCDRRYQTQEDAFRRLCRPPPPPSPLLLPAEQSVHEPASSLKAELPTLDLS